MYVSSDRWDSILAETNFLEFVHEMLANGAEDDLILESIMLVGTLCKNEKCADSIAKSFLIGMLHDLLGAK